VSERLGEGMVALDAHLLGTWVKVARERERKR